MTTTVQPLFQIGNFVRNTVDNNISIVLEVYPIYGLVDRENILWYTYRVCGIDGIAEKYTEDELKKYP
jgi:hypothetical protein